MKQFSFQTNIRLSLGKGLSIALLMLALNSQAQQIDMDNGVLGIADDRGFTLQSKDGRFVFKPYLFL